MGLTNLILVLSEDQRTVAESIESKGMASNLGWHDSVSEVDLATAIPKSVHDRMRRRKTSDLGRKLADGHGAAKAVAGLRRETL